MTFVRVVEDRQELTQITGLTFSLIFNLRASVELRLNQVKSEIHTVCPTKSVNAEWNWMVDIGWICLLQTWAFESFDIYSQLSTDWLAPRTVRRCKAHCNVTIILIDDFVVHGVSGNEKKDRAFIHVFPLHSSILRSIWVLHIAKVGSIPSP